MKLLIVSLCAVAACGSSPNEGAIGSRIDPIVGGTLDPGDPAVMMLVAWDPRGTLLDVCTAALIAPDALLTAAHCIDPVTHPGYLFGVHPGADGTNIVLTSLTPIAEVHPHPRYEAATSTNDIGVVVLTVPIAIPPIPVNRAKLDLMQMGAQTRIVGYGRSDYNNSNSAGLRRQATTTLDRWDDATATVGDGTHHTCLGDSGAPALLAMGGIESILGTDSHALTGCTGASTFMRTDHYLDFLAPWLPAAPQDFGAGSSDASVGAPSMMTGGGCDVGGAREAGALWWIVAATLGVALTVRRRAAVLRG